MTILRRNNQGPAGMIAEADTWTADQGSRISSNSIVTTYCMQTTPDLCCVPLD